MTADLAAYAAGLWLHAGVLPGPQAFGKEIEVPGSVLEYMI